MILKLVVLLALVELTSSYPSYQNNIPNGANVINPCDGTPWPGVGHRKPQGSGQLNSFGAAFAAANHVWTTALCKADSDGDGRTNGQELGDANCNWTAGDSSAHADNVAGHPGVCEPVESSACSSSWFSCSGPPVG